MKKKESVKPKAAKTPKVSNGKVGLLNIRNKIFLCFVLPIICMILVGYVSFRLASDGMSDKFLQSSAQTINMAMQYMDLTSKGIEQEAARYQFDANIESYILGMPGKSKVEKANFFSDERVVFMSSQSANSAIANIHVIPKSITDIISTVTPDKKPGIYDEYLEELLSVYGDKGSIPKWTTQHTMIDEYLGLSANDYFLSYQIPTSKQMSYIIIDVKPEALQGILENMNFGTGSFVGLITEDGKEIAMECGKEGMIDGMFASESFFTSAQSSEALSGDSSVNYKGSNYLFLYQKSELNGITICALIPADTVTKQAESIKTITLVMVIIAAVFSFAVGMIITGGIQRNMKRISKKLDEVAKGNLSVTVDAKGSDEFQNLARSASNMVVNNRKLVLKLSGTADELQGSAKNVNDASEDIRTSSEEITQAISEISRGVEKQSEHALECVNITNTLSEKIGNIIADVSTIHDKITEAEDLIGRGTNMVGNLSEGAREASDKTEDVGRNISLLSEEANNISEFVHRIAEIAHKTNMLSLNASIEAARAGEAGRGFAVVAEQIRDLADSSAAASNEISNKIDIINDRTRESVDAANNASSMVLSQQQLVDDVTNVFDSIKAKMQELLEALDKISDSASDADIQRKETVDAVDNISSIIEETAASSSLVMNMTDSLKSSVDRLGQTADSLDENMSGLKKEISAFSVE
ncbi:MAG: methyl-accepting chemotaxis protein [Lachnospiraceae bacterium]|nr:methyl-accepting chemotaxis protein [Lachnospiraceae bacterium]